MLRYVDLSDTNWDKRSMEYLVQALSCSTVRPSGSPETSPNAANHAENVPDQEVPEKGSIGEVEDEDDEDDSLGDRSSAYGSFVPPAPLLRDHDDEQLPSSVQTLRMEGCSLRNAALELLGKSEPGVNGGQSVLMIRRPRHPVVGCQTYITSAEPDRPARRRGIGPHDQGLPRREYQHVCARAIIGLAWTYARRQRISRS